MMTRVSLHLVIACIALTGFPTRASGQESVARSFADLVGLVRPGTEVVLTDRNGRELAGVVAEVTAQELTLAGHDRAQVFRKSDLVEIRERRSDSLLNGTLWGLAIGVGAVAGITAIAASAHYYIHEERLPTAFVWFGAAGAGVGALIDGLKKHRRTLYQSTWSVTLELQATPRQGVLAVGLRF